MARGEGSYEPCPTASSITQELPGTISTSELPPQAGAPSKPSTKPQAPKPLIQEYQPPLCNRSVALSHWIGGLPLVVFTLEDWADRLLDAFLDSDSDAARSIVASALDAGHEPRQILLHCVGAALVKLSGRWREGQASMAHLYVAGRIADGLADALLAQAEANVTTPEDAPRIVLGNAPGDYHGLGRMLVRSFLRASGFGVLDLGLDVAPESFVRAAQEAGSELVCISALMYASAARAADVRSALNAAGLRHVKLLVGGAPFRMNRALADRVGADAAGESALDAPALAASLLGWRPPDKGGSR